MDRDLPDIKQAVDKSQPAPPLALPRKRAGEKIRKEANFSQDVESKGWG
jgi:hypothetical protein